MTFRPYNVSTGGTALATDTHTTVVTDGLFNTGIDFDQSYFDGRELWLGATVEADSEMMTGQPLTSVPYAFHVGGADKLDGHDASEFINKTDLDHYRCCSMAVPQMIVHVDDDGNVGIGTTAPQKKLYMVGIIRFESPFQSQRPYRYEYTGRLARLHSVYQRAPKRYNPWYGRH